MEYRIRKEEYPSLLDVLDRDRYSNLFFINDIIRYGDADDIAAYRVTDTLYALSFRETSMLLYSTGGYSKDDAISFLSRHSWKALMGPEDTLKALEDSFNTENSYRKMLKADTQCFRKKPRDERLRVLNTRKDYKELMMMYRKVASFRNDFPASEDDLAIDRFMSEDYPFAAVGLAEDGRIRSGAYLSAASRRCAMIVGVATEPGYEGRGFASSVVSELLDIALNQFGLEYICLWYSTERAHRVYSKLGFMPVSDYAYFKRKENEIRQIH